MGAIMAKINNSNTIDSLELGIDYNLFNKNKLSLDLNKMKNYINKYGYIKMEVDQSQLENYINSYVNKYFKYNEKDIMEISKSVGLVYSLGSLTLSNMGLFVLIEKSDNNKRVISGIIPEVKPEIKLELFQEVKPEIKSEIKAEIKSELLQVVKPEIKAEIKSELLQVVKPEIKSELLQVVKSVVKSEVKSEVTSEIKSEVSSEVKSNNNVVSKQDSAIILDVTKGQFFILLPKIYFSHERNDFIDFISQQTDDINASQRKIIFTIIRKLLDKINDTPNPEVKILNTIGLLVRVGLLIQFINIIQKNLSKYSDEEKINLFVGILSENLEDIPYDECIFYNDKLNFLKFSPNICEQAKNNKIQNLKQQYGILPESEQIQCPTSNYWKYTSGILFFILIILILVFVLRSKNTQFDISNLSRLS